MRFEEPRPRPDVCHKRYVRADKSGHCDCAHATYAFGRNWARPNLGPPHRTARDRALSAQPVSLDDRQTAPRPVRKRDIRLQAPRATICMRAAKIIPAFRSTSASAHANVSLFVTSAERFSAVATIFCQFAAENNAAPRRHYVFLASVAS